MLCARYARRAGLALQEVASVCRAGASHGSLRGTAGEKRRRTAGLVARPSSCTKSGTLFLAVASSTRQNLPSATHACACNAIHLTTCALPHLSHNNSEQQASGGGEGHIPVEANGSEPTCSGAGTAPAASSTAASLGEVSACTSTSSRPFAFKPLKSATCVCVPHQHDFPFSSSFKGCMCTRHQLLTPLPTRFTCPESMTGTRPPIPRRYTLPLYICVRLPRQR